MTQPTINFEDGTFPRAEVSEIDRLTAAVQDLTSAVDNLAAEVQLSRGVPSQGVYAAVVAARDKVATASDPNVEHVDPDSPEAVEEFWRDSSVRDLHDALVGPANEPVGVPVGALDNVPDNWVAVLDPPVYMSEATASWSDIHVGHGLWVRKVWRTCGIGVYGWSFLEAGESDEAGPWGANVDQVRVLGLRYDDFSAPEG